jgi:hypothetical protein
MSADRSSKTKDKDRLPRGIILITVLLWTGAFFTAGIMLVPTATLAQFNLPRSLLLVGALALAVLGYGLIRGRRWGWIATLLFIFVNGYSIVVNALAGGTLQYVGLLVLIAAAVYLLRPNIRARFLGKPRA